MSFTLKSITTETVSRPPRIILLGVEKIGKSEFCAGADNPIFIPIKREEGIDSIRCAKFPVCDTLQKVKDALNVLLDEDHDFETAVIDSASTLEPLVWEGVCEKYNVDSIEKVDGGYGKGYTAALLEWFELMELCDRLRDEKNMATIFIGHVKVKRFDDPERASYDQYQMDLNEKVANALYRWSDFIGFANRNISVTSEEVGFRKKKNKGIDVDAETHYLFTKKTPAHPGGGRGLYGKLPSEIPLYWKDFKEAVVELMEAEKPKTTVKKKSA